MAKTKFGGTCLFICAGLLIGLIIKLFVFEFLTVSGRSMLPTIQDGDKIFINKLAYGIVKPYSNSLLVQWSQPQRDDLVIYLYDNKIVVKRCVAVAGDLLEYSEDRVYTLRTGGKEISLTENQHYNLKNSSSVPEGYILAVGDNYEESIDSRTYGFVSVHNILGKVICK
ncbi:MAG: signal peptidase I [Treponema sp.]|nr:signal peptidase I [Candidatus Treponema equifaecale]